MSYEQADTPPFGPQQPFFLVRPDGTKIHIVNDQKSLRLYTLDSTPVLLAEVPNQSVNRIQNFFASAKNTIKETATLVPRILNNQPYICTALTFSASYFIIGRMKRNMTVYQMRCLDASFLASFMLMSASAIVYECYNWVMKKNRPPSFIFSAAGVMFGIYSSKTI